MGIRCWSFIMLLVSLSPALAQTREEMVREDRRKVTSDGFWIYNDLPEAFRRADETGKPILVVLRCIPCKECVKLDDDLVDKHPVIRPLLDDFVCVRQVSTNGLDLETFQFDTDQSFAAFMLNADRTVYGRFGTRSHRTEWLSDVSLDGLAAALKGALALHANYPANRAALAGKQGGQPEVSSPEKYPSLAEKYTDSLDYSGEVARSCIHCHQIGEAQRQFYWDAGKPIPERVLFPYPHPKITGMILDPDHKALIKEVRDGSAAHKAGLQADDEIIAFDGQPPISMADIQWVLHQADPDGAEIPMTVRRGDEEMSLTLSLPRHWRREGDLSWRASTWALRRMVTGGMVLKPLDPEERDALGLDRDTMALRATHVGQYNAHAAAKRAGVKRDDVIISYDGRSDLTTEEALIHHAINETNVGDRVQVGIRRGERTFSVKIPIQP